MINILRYIIASFLIIFLISCDDNPTKTQNLKYNVALAFVIDADSLRQKALLTSVNSVDDEYSEYPELIDSAYFYVNNIKLSYSLPDFTKPYSRNHYYNYYSDSLYLQPGDTLNISIVKNDINIIGKAIIPGEVTITVVGRTISWTTSTNAYYYHIEIENEARTFVWETATNHLSVTIADDNFIQDEYKIKITSFDKNYFLYYEDRINQSGIEGAYGFFGAVNSTKIKAFIN